MISFDCIKCTQNAQLDYPAARKSAARLGGRGAGVISAPVNGMEKCAIVGTLTAMCGGEAETPEQIRLCLSRVADRREWLLLPEDTLASPAATAADAGLKDQLPF